MKIKKAILTGGGRATRLHPVTTTINKHLLPLANKPMIFHAIEKVVEAGVEEIFINTNPGETQLQQFIGDGGHWGVKITFFEQTGGPQGIAHVVKCAEQFIGNDPFIFYLSDNIFLGSLVPMFEEFHEKGVDSMLAFSRVPDPHRFGVPVFDVHGKLVDTLEKPASPPNDFAITGLYLFGPNVFFDAFNHIQKSARGEYELPDIISHLLKQGKSVGYKEITGWWKDTGKADDLLLANKLLLDQMDDADFVRLGTVAAGAKLTGKVHVGAGSVIGSGVIITGPVIIGENARIERATIGPCVTIGAGATIAGATIENSILLENDTVDGDITIADSLLGKSVSLKSAHRVPRCQMLLGDKTIIHLP